MKDNNNISALVDAFEAHTYKDPESGFELKYRLFVPELKAGEKYPLILFMHGGGEKGSDNLAQLCASEGATVWVEEAQQSECPCYVLAPQCPESTDWVDPDTYEPREAVLSVYRLLTQVVVANPVDTKRLYSTGLSMGAMGIWELNASHPNLFASMLIAVGQSNHERMAVLKNKPIWAWCAENDDKAAEGLAEIMNTIELAGGQVLRESIDASLPPESLAAYAAASLKQAGSIRHTQYIEGTLDEPWAHFGWKQVYANPTVRKWFTGFINDRYSPDTAKTPVPFHSTPVPLSAGDLAYKAASAGGRHSLILGEDGNVYGFGCNICGQLAMPKMAAMTVKEAPVKLLEGEPVKKICAGGNFTAILLQDGRVLACGGNTQGQLGSKSGPCVSILKPIENLGGIIDIGVGERFLLALDDSGFVWGLGDNSNGQMVDGAYLKWPAPKRLQGQDGKPLSGVTAISVGMRSAFFQLKDGTLLACGNGEYGQLGSGFAGHGPSKPALSHVYAGPDGAPLKDIAQIAPGRCFTLARTNKGEVLAWGLGTHGELGGSETELHPVKVDGLENIVDVAAGMNHALALDGEGRVFSWGYNNGMGAGVLGHEDTNTVPTQISGLPRIEAISAGTSHNLLIDTDGGIWGFGNAADGRLLS